MFIPTVSPENRGLPLIVMFEPLSFGAEGSDGRLLPLVVAPHTQNRVVTQLTQNRAVPLAAR